MNELGFMASFLLGIAASSHCVLMCGPLSAVMLIGREDNLFYSHALLLNLGRITTYVVFACVSVLVVKAMGLLLAPENWSDILRVTLALSIILAGVQLLFGARIFRRFERSGGCLFSRLKTPIQYLLTTKQLGASFFLGLCWGLVPCGLVYSLVLMAAASGNFTSAIGIVVAFGLGTLPVLMVAGMTASRIAKSLRGQKLRYLSGALIICLGMLMLVPIEKSAQVPLLSEDNVPNFLCH